MTVDSLIQIVALVIAVYALVPRVRQLEMKVKFGLFWMVLSVIYVILITFLLYYEEFQKLFNLLAWPDKWVFLPRDVAFFTTIYLVGVIWFIYQRTKIGRRDIFRFQELVGELIRIEEYSEIVTLLEQNWDDLFYIYKLRFPVSRLKKKIRKHIAPIALRNDLSSIEWDYDDVSINDILAIRLENKNIKTKKIFFYYFETFYFYLMYWFTFLLPDYSKHSESTEEIFQMTLTNEYVVSALSKMRPYFAFRILNVKLLQTEAFLKIYFSRLIRNSQSILYYEIQNMENISFGKGNGIRKGHRLLYFLFHDAVKAEELNIWKPVGDELLDILEEKKHLAGEDDEFNLPPRDHDDEIAHSSISIVICFFNIMVLSALYQGIRWHMWLYYFPAFVEKILVNISPGKMNDASAEFPTKYHLFLYEIFDRLNNWIEEGVDLIETGQPNVILEHIDDRHENENILKSSIIALSQCLNHLLSSNSVTEEFKQSRMDSVFRLYFKLRKNPFSVHYAVVLKETLRNANFYSQPNASLWRAVKRHFNSFDKYEYPKEDIEEFIG